ncbi:hypothetical protein [Cellulomonas denverensis]|uniref:Uncharacterized protein n=1 Tax=Cellulomonas denverensis TaxID=264297 RepID=A0A7X6KY46_9CELL|nr:hypothetical protein [Cellulomonas denverensis]NKY24333.1 hypothetical protein [Cellulomonas denverensis]
MKSKSRSATSAAAAWPRISVVIRDDGTGQVRVAGMVTAEIAATDAASARQEATRHLTATAKQFGRPVQAATQDPEGEWEIVVSPDGSVRGVDSDSTRAPRRPKRARTTPATSPASRKREGAVTPGRGVPPTGHDREPRPPFTAALHAAERAAAERAEREAAERAEREAAERAEREAAERAEREAAERAEREAAERADLEAAVRALEARVIEAAAVRRAAAGKVPADLEAALSEAIRGASELARYARGSAAANVPRAAQEAATLAGDVDEVVEAVRRLVLEYDDAAAQLEQRRAAEAASASSATAAALHAARSVEAPDFLGEAPDGASETKPDEVAVVDGDQVARALASGRRRPRARTWIAVAVAIALVAVGATQAQRVWVAREVTAAHAQWTEEQLGLTTDVQAAQELLASSEGKVTDDAFLEDLQAAIARALDARADPSEAGSSVPAAAWREAEREVIAAGAVLRSAVSAVEESRAAWELERATKAWQKARSDLSAAMDDANAVIASSVNQVADDGVRQALADAVAQAIDVRDVDVDDATAEALDAAAAAAAAETKGLAAPTQAVRDAQAAWLAEQERAAAAAAAQAAARPTTPAAGGSRSPAQEQPPAANAAPPASTSGAGASTELWIRPGSVGCTTKDPYDFSVSATTGGVSGPVVVTIGGVSQTIGTGSGSFSGTLKGLPAGSYSWSVSADGLVVSGSKTVVVPCPAQ